MSMNQAVTLGVLVGPQVLTSFGDLKKGVTPLWQTTGIQSGQGSDDEQSPTVSQSRVNDQPCWGLGG